MTFQYPDPVLVPPPEGDPIRIQIEEPLTGFVQGKEASDLEENVGWAHEFLGIQFFFKYNVSLLGLQDSFKEIDFVGIVGPWYQPIEVDGDIGHITEAQQGADELRDALLESELFVFGFRQIIRLPERDVDSREKALEQIREIYS